MTLLRQFLDGKFLKFCSLSQFSEWGTFFRMDHFFFCISWVANILSGNYSGVNCPGGNYPRWQLSEGNYPGGNLPGWQLSGGGNFPGGICH